VPQRRPGPASRRTPRRCAAIADVTVQAAAKANDRALSSTSSPAPWQGAILTLEIGFLIAACSDKSSKSGANPDDRRSNRGSCGVHRRLPDGALTARGKADRLGLGTERRNKWTIRVHANSESLSRANRPERPLAAVTCDLNADGRTKLPARRPPGVSAAAPLPSSSGAAQPVPPRTVEDPLASSSLALPKRILKAVLIVRQPGGFCHRRGFACIHAVLLRLPKQASLGPIGS